MSDCKHKEAFALMWYACRCGHRERIWNSRDGVTPFGVACPSCGDGLLHVNWHLDRKAPDHVLHPGQRYFRDGTMEEAIAIVKRRIASSKGSTWEPTPEDAERMISEVRAGEWSEFQPGWPVVEVNTRKP